MEADRVTSLPIARLPFKGLDTNVALLCFAYLPPATLRVVEEVCVALHELITRGNVWRRVFLHNVTAHGWSAPRVEPSSWKAYLATYEREIRVRVHNKEAYGACTLYWRVALGGEGNPITVRSREFGFADDALGEQIRWQMEFDVGETIPHSTGRVANRAQEGVAQPAALRLWTTNEWTATSAEHYFGAYCVMSVRDSLNTMDVIPEQHIDIDVSQPFSFMTSDFPPEHAMKSEVLIKINLTLALELALPLNPYYNLLTPPVLSGGEGVEVESDVVKVGYCRAIFEIARCKRKVGCNFVKTSDCNVDSLVFLSGDPGTSEELRVEVFQALFNLLGPSAVLVKDETVAQLLHFSTERLRIVLNGEVGFVEKGLIVQNVLGNVFNLLAHPMTRRVLSRMGVGEVVSSLLFSPEFETSKFSVIMILLTMRSWADCDAAMNDLVVSGVAAFMKCKDPLDSEATGVAWDESDIASFFLPLLRANDVVCVSFASWCLGLYYFGHPPS